MVLFRDGHTTFFISAFTFLRNFIHFKNPLSGEYVYIVYFLQGKVNEQKKEWFYIPLFEYY